MSERQHLFLCLCIVSLLVPTVRPDLCTKCYKLDTEGNWKFTIDTKTYEPNLFDAKVHCGHPQPNTQHVKAKVDLHRPREIQATFESPNIFVLHGASGQEEGWWTMVYNLGFMAKTDSYEFIGEFDYESKAFSLSSYSCVSHCDRTMSSWYKDLRTGRLGCFYGQKIKIFEASPQTFAQGRTVVRESSAARSLLTQLRDIKYEDLAFLVDKINKQTDGTWKAELNPEYIGKTLKELTQLMGKSVATPAHISLSNVINFLKAPEQRRFGKEPEKSRYLKKDFSDALMNSGFDVDTSDPVLKYWYSHVDDIPAEELPKEWDWRDVDGVDYVNPPRRQDKCGSCYIIGSLNTLETRVRIATKNRIKPLLSPQQVLSCSSYSEGCKGGEAVMVGKFGTNFDYIPDHCFKYTHNNGKCEYTCKNSLFSGYHIRNAFSNYLGDYHGSPGMNEENMRKEIRARGPITIGILTPPFLTFYKSGVTGCSGRLLPKADLSESEEEIMRRIQDGFRPVEHLVVAVGWGEQKDGQKYWIVQNTWGVQHGIKGYFLLKRGVNECACESDVAPLYPKLIRG